MNYDPMSRKIFEMRTESIRENMVPAAKWFNDFKAIEARGFPQGKMPITLYIPQATKSWLDHRWSLPYPFGRSVFEGMLMLNFPGRTMVNVNEVLALGPEKLYMYQMTLQDRIEGFMNNTITEEYLSFLDSNEDFGVMLQTTNGNLVPFEYTELDHVELVNIPVAAEINIAAFAGREKINLTDPELDMSLQSMFERQNECNAWLRMYFKDPEGDFFNKAQNHIVDINVTQRLTMDAPSLYEMFDYVKNMIKNRAKVIKIL